MGQEAPRFFVACGRRRAIAEQLACRGIRGAIDVGDGGVEAATRALLDAIVERNGCAIADIALVTFSLPDDLPLANPAAAARALGWDQVPLMLVREHPVSLDIPRCLRVLILWNTTRPQSEVRHAYLGRAAVLRPDLAGERA